ncbi:hypothetical protein RGQ29_019541 [Quercus rubra]|uniref:F-box domain-containing protein n=1 Tax=Quercus rubra TaxID=3512 RepID=A0AAN7FEA7_QUERU|nr:hypothetical protein RGQ29_019541 [Quercus rubra]
MEKGKKQDLSVAANPNLGQMIPNLNLILNANFPSDVISDILYQLPVKTLVRFRCVSKRWCSQIDGPDFIKLQLRHSLATQTNLHVILKKWYLYMVEYESLQPAIELSAPLKVIWGITEVFGSCNGLVAVCNSENEMALWNPSTRKSQRLPFEPVEHPGGVELRRFAFYGFGCDPISEDYKVVRMVQFVAQDDEGDLVGDDEDGFFYAEVKVYSMKSNSWRKINDLPYYVRFLFQLNYLLFYRRGYGVFACSAVHWVASVGLGLYLIVAFDLGVEKFQNVPLPGVVDNGFEMDVGVLEGRLCIILNYRHVYVDIWVMKEYGVKESWTKLFKVSADSSLKRPLGHIVPLAYSKSGDKVLLAVEKRKLFWYNIRKRRAEKVRIEGAPKSFGADFYMESLVPVGRDGMDQRRQQPQGEMKKIYRKRMDDFLSKGFKLTL